jgi:hypothetical protein
MGLKYTTVVHAASLGLYIPLKINDGKPFPLAKVVVVPSEKGVTPSKNKRMGYALRYPNGVLGHLGLTADRQLEPYFFEFADPAVPLSAEDMLAMDDKLPSSSFVFDRTYVARDIPASELEARALRDHLA